MLPAESMRMGVRLGFQVNLIPFNCRNRPVVPYGGVSGERRCEVNEGQENSSKERESRWERKRMRKRENEKCVRVCVWVCVCVCVCAYCLIFFFFLEAFPVFWMGRDESCCEVWTFGFFFVSSLRSFFLLLFVFWMFMALPYMYFFVLVVIVIPIRYALSYGNGLKKI